MFANVTVVAGAPQKVVTLPRTAIVYRLYGNNAFVVVPRESGGCACMVEAPLQVPASAPETRRSGRHP